MTMMGGADALLGVHPRRAPAVGASALPRRSPTTPPSSGTRSGGLFGTYVLLTEPAHVPALRHREPVAVVGRRHDVRVRSATTRRRTTTFRPRRSSRSARTKTTTAANARRAGSPPTNAPRPGCATSTWSPTPSAWSPRCAARQLSEPRDRQRGPARRVPHHRAAPQPVAIAAVPLRRAAMNRFNGRELVRHRAKPSGAAISAALARQSPRSVCATLSTPRGGAGVQGAGVLRSCVRLVSASHRS